MDTSRGKDLNHSSKIPQDGYQRAGLTEVQERVLSYAGAIGKEVDFNLLKTSLDMDEELLAEALESLVQRGVFREVKGGDRYVFTKEDIMAQASRTLSSSRLRLVHKHIAEAYEKLYPSPPPEIIPLMARHFYLGKIHDKSILYNRYSATIARSNFSPDVAIQYLDRVSEDLGAMEGDHKLEEADVFRELGDLYILTGDAQKADEMYAKSLEKVPKDQGTLRALTLLARSEATREMDRLILTRNYCDDAIKYFESIGHKKGQAMGHRQLSRAAYKEGKLEIGKKEIDATLALLNPSDDAKDIARCYIDLGNVYSNSDDPKAQALSANYFRKAIAALEPLNDYRELSRAHNNLAVLLATGDPREALAELDLAKEYAEKTKDKRSVGWALFNSVEFLLAIGEEAKAEKAHSESEQIISRLDDPLGMQQVTLNRGVLAQRRKDYQGAEAAYLDSLRRAEGLGYPGIIVEMDVRLARLYIEWGRTPEARKCYAAAEKLGIDKLSPSIRALALEASEKLKSSPA